jgi:hypothetical protein
VNARPEVLALVGPDGHARLVAITAAFAPEVARAGILMAEAGVDGWRTVTMPAAEAVRRFCAAARCTGCVITWPCGCPAVLAGWRTRCPHGTSERLHAAAHRLGWCANNHRDHWGPPL